MCGDGESEMTSPRIGRALMDARHLEVQQQMTPVEQGRTLDSQVGRCAAAAVLAWIWLGALLGDVRTEMLVAFAAGPTGGQRLRSRAAAQSLVEWSLAAAVLAFVGIAAWQLAGTAITDAVNRTITNLNKAGA